jgi:hypothetical protein
MHDDGFMILMIPFFGLFAICRDGRWRWKVVEVSSAWNAIFWFGWLTALLVGLLRVSGLA